MSKTSKSNAQRAWRRDARAFKTIRPHAAVNHVGLAAFVFAAKNVGAALLIVAIEALRCRLKSGRHTLHERVCCTRSVATLLPPDSSDALTAQLPDACCGIWRHHVRSGRLDENFL